jgi:parallel beta-helix repeat protein
MSQGISRKVFLAVVLALLIVVAGSIFLNFPITDASQPQFLDVSISPPGPVTLSVNQAQLFTAEVANQSLGPFSYAWTDENGTLLSSGASYLFVASQAFTSERLCVTVTSKDGQKGYAYVDLEDPYATQSIYMDALLSGGASLEIQYDGVGWWQIINDSGAQIFSNSSLVVIEQDAVNVLAPSGGLIILRETTWEGSVTIPGNIVVLSYYQGTINYYGSNGIKYNGVSLATTSSFQTYPYGNLTGAPTTWAWGNITGIPILLYANGTQALTSNWNMGASGTYGISGLSWVNATSITVSGTGTFGNVVSTEPIGDYSYLIYLDPITHKCTAKAANGTICWSASGWDATLVIQSAISAINATGYPGIIDFSPGQYPIDNLNITGGITLCGTGVLPQQATLWQSGPYNMMNYVQSATDFAFTIKNLELGGARKYYATGSGLYVAPQGGQEFDDVLIDRVFFYGFPAYGIYTTCSWGWMIENSIFEYNCANNTAAYGLYVGGNPPQALITNNKIISNYGNGLYCGSGNSIITYNQIESNAGTGVCIYDANDVSLSGNIVAYNKGNGITVLSGAWKSSISANHIFLNGGEGLYISDDSPYCTVSGNVFHGNTGIQAHISAPMCTILSNNFDLGMSQGLELDGSGSTVMENVFCGNGNSTTCQFALETSNCTVTGNTFNGYGLSGYGIQISQITSGANDLITSNNFYGHIGTYWSFQNAVYLSMPCLAIFRDNTGINLLTASSTFLYQIGGVGYIFSLGRDAIYGNGNVTSTWASDQTYTVEAFDVIVYLSGGGNSTTVVVNGNTIVSAAQITTLTIPAPIGTTITIIDSSSMPTISIVHVPQ